MTLNLLKVRRVTMHTVPLSVGGGMVCAVCALLGYFVQTLAAKGSALPQISLTAAACTSTRDLLHVERP